MTKLRVNHFLQQDSSTLGTLSFKLNQFKQWNDWLNECLPEGTLSLHCQIVGLKGTSLIVIADSPHWVARFRFHVPELLEKLRKYTGFEKIQAICCKVQPNYSPTPAKKTQPILKLSLKSAQSLLEIANKIQDKKLKAAMQKLAQNT